MTGREMIERRVASRRATRQEWRALHRVLRASERLGASAAYMDAGLYFVSVNAQLGQAARPWLRAYDEFTVALMRAFAEAVRRVA